LLANVGDGPIEELYLFGPFDDRLANSYPGLTRNEQYSVELNFIANPIWQLLKADDITLSDAILLATGLYYRVPSSLHLAGAAIDMCPGCPVVSLKCVDIDEHSASNREGAKDAKNSSKNLCDLRDLRESSGW
jgi:hypothetical protein